MSEPREPREPRFEDDFFDEPSDDDPQEPLDQVEFDEQATTLLDIAIVKAHAYAQEYNPSTGTVQDKPNYHALKEGYMAGFLEGFAHRLTHNTGE
jgi:hypothetical protein